MIEHIIKRLEVGANAGASVMAAWPDIKQLIDVARSADEEVRQAEAETERYRLRLIAIRQVCEEGLPAEKEAP